MTGTPVTTNPLLIMVINMTIVFGVLFLLGYVIQLIHLVDPTRKKESVADEAAPLLEVVAEQEIAATSERPMEEKELAAVVTTAIMAYGYQNVKIKSIKKV